MDDAVDTPQITAAGAMLSRRGGGIRGQRMPYSGTRMMGEKSRSHGISSRLRLFSDCRIHAFGVLPPPSIGFGGADDADTSLETGAGLNGCTGSSDSSDLL